MCGLLERPRRGRSQGPWRSSAADEAQPIHTCEVPWVVGQQWHVVKDGRGSNPGVRTEYPSAALSSPGVHLRPKAAELAVRIVHGVRLHEASELASALVSPTADLRPGVQLRPSHERDQREPAREMRLVKGGTGVVLEEVGHDIRVND